MTYLVRFTPLEPYAFGTDQKFKYPGEKETGKETYYVKSKDTPEQTTILGTLRFLMLEETGLLKTDFQYSPEERKAMERLIGPESFSFLSKNRQNFGCIKRISPVFLSDESGDYYVKNPFHNRGSMQYEPMKMEERTVITSAGEMNFPETGSYDAKKGHGSGYVNLNTGEVREDLIRTVAVTGNRKNGILDTNEDCFFKRELKSLKQGFAFSVFAELEGQQAPTEAKICFMGQKKSVFRVTWEERENTLVDQVKKAFETGSSVWDYALSDLYPNGKQKYHNFCITEEKQLRNLETVYGETNHIRRLRKSERRFSLITGGSVFYKNCGLDLKNENCEQIGYNQIVKIGG